MLRFEYKVPEMADGIAVLAAIDRARGNRWLGPEYTSGAVWNIDLRWLWPWENPWKARKFYPPLNTRRTLRRIFASRVCIAGRLGSRIIQV